METNAHALSQLPQSADLIGVPGQPVIADVVEFVTQLPEKPQSHTYHANSRGKGHIQGLASAIYQYEGKSRVIDFLTKGDYKAKENGILYILDRKSKRAWWYTLDYPHPGGCQVAGDFLAVPYHLNQETCFYDIRQLARDGKRLKPRKVSAFVIEQGGSKHKVPYSIWCDGFVKLHDGSFRLAILQSGITFYDGQLEQGELLFHKVATWPEDLTLIGRPNNANLVCDAQGCTWLLAFTDDESEGSKVTAYKLRFGSGRAFLDKLAQKKVNGSNAFRYGAGVSFVDITTIGVAASDSDVSRVWGSELHLYASVSR